MKRRGGPRAELQDEVEREEKGVGLFLEDG